jgi:hypothetical protein
MFTTSAVERYFFVYQVIKKDLVINIMHQEQWEQKELKRCC